MALTSGVTRTSTLLLTCPPHSKLCFEASLAGRIIRFLWSSRWRGASTLHTVPKAQLNERVLKARSPPFGAPEVLCPQQLYSASCELIFCTRLHCCLVRRTRTIGEALRSSSCAQRCAREVLFRRHGVKLTALTRYGLVGLSRGRQPNYSASWPAHFA